MSFAQIEREAWSASAVARAYADGFPAMVQFTVGPLWTAAAISPGGRVLDLACGPGTLSRAAPDPEPETVGLDFSLPMLERARRETPRGSRWVVGRAERLPLADGRFDAVLCNFGLLHFADPERALREAARVLRPGGRLAFTVWGADAVGLRLIPDALEALQLAPPLPAAPGFFAYAQAGTFRRSFAEAGLVEASERRVEGLGRVPSVDGYWRMFLEGSARTRAGLLQLSPEDRERVRVEVARRLEPYVRPEGVQLPVTAVLGSARRPAA